MKNKIIDFLKNETGATEECNINYRPYLYGSLVESVNFMELVEKIYSDFIELCEIAINVDRKEILNDTLKMYKEHLVVF